jgi:hypothetical protein
VKGEKHHPYPVPGGAVQLDGTAAEFNIHPCTTVDSWVRNIGTVMDSLKEMTRASGYVLSASPVADFDPTYFELEVPSSAKKLGCDPDYDAWELCANDAPNASRTFRTGAGHIHIGWGSGFDCMGPEHFDLCARLSRQLDYTLGTYSLLWDSESRRRELYGKAGAFRPKPYGLEYRTLSNAWLQSELLQRWVFASTKKALKDWDDGLRYEDGYGDIARSIINTNDVKWYGQPESPVIHNLPLPPGAKVA